MSIMSSSQNITAAAMADPVGQIIMLTLPNGQAEPVPLSVVDNSNNIMIVTSIGYGVEIGASLVMLAAILTMTPKTKFWRLSTYLNIASLCNNIIRVVLLATYFNSSYVAFYALYSHDYSHITSTDRATTVASTAMTVPQNVLVMSALTLQAWAMVRLWPRAYKWVIFAMSVILVLLEIGFMAAAEAYQIMQLSVDFAVGHELVVQHLWVRYGFLGLEVTCICWFCFLFICKLLTHLWTSRSFLPKTKGLGAMDALVMTNGVLMLIPVFFAGLQYSWTVRFEAGSMVYTSVIVVLPLGTLVAQRIADPSAFNSELSANARIENKMDDRFDNFTANKNALLNPTWSQSSKDSGVFSGRRGSNKALSGRTGVTATVSSGGPMTSADIELARVDADIEAGHVRVDREIQQSEQVL